MDGTLYYSQDEEEEKREEIEIGDRRGRNKEKRSSWDNFKETVRNAIGKKEQEEKEENGAVEENDNVKLFARLKCPFTKTPRQCLAEKGIIVKDD